MRTCLVLSAVLGFFVSSAAAQTVSLTPSVVELKGRHGQSVTHRLTITNRSDIPLAFEMEAQDVIVAEGKRLFIRAGDLPHSIAVTARFSENTVTVAPGESRVVNVTLTVPPSAVVRAVAALFKGTTRIANGAGAATVSLGTLFTFTLSDEHVLATSELSVSPQSATQNAAFEVTFTNDGSEPVTPRGVAAILDGRGAMVGKVSFDAVRVLPGERLKVKARYPGELEAGAYRIAATFELPGKAVTRTAQLIVQ